MQLPCMFKETCIVSIVLYACHMQHALKTFKIPACHVHVTCTQHANMHGKHPCILHAKNMPVTCRDLGLGLALHQ